MQTTADIIRLISEVLVLLGVLIPMVIAFARAIKKAAKERNWSKLLDLAMSLIAQAETEFAEGADKKSFVMQMLKASLEEIDYEISDEDLSDLVDKVVELTKKVNIK